MFQNACGDWSVKEAQDFVASCTAERSNEFHSPATISLVYTLRALTCTCTECAHANSTETAKLTPPSFSSPPLQGEWWKTWSRFRQQSKNECYFWCFGPIALVSTSSPAGTSSMTLMRTNKLDGYVWLSATSVSHLNICPCLNLPNGCRMLQDFLFTIKGTFILSHARIGISLDFAHVENCGMGLGRLPASQRGSPNFH